MPGAPCTPAASRGKNKNHMSIVTTGPPEHPAFPHANGFNGFLRALPGEPGLLSPSQVAMRKHCRPLDISVGTSSARFPKFADPCSTLFRELRKSKGTSKI